MKNKLNNLISQEDFISNWKAEQAKKTKRTETGLDILKESLEDETGEDLISNELTDDLSTDRDDSNDGVEEIIPEGPIDNDFDMDHYFDYIMEELPELSNDTLDDIINYFREALLELEQTGEIENGFTDELDDQYEDDWVGWIADVITLPDLPEEAIKNVYNIILGSEEDSIDDEQIKSLYI